MLSWGTRFYNLVACVEVGDAACLLEIPGTKAREMPTLLASLPVRSEALVGEQVGWT